MTTNYNKYLKYKLKYKQLQDRFLYPSYDTIEKRKNEYNLLKNNKFNINNKIIIIGFGAIGTALLYLILQLFIIDPKNITIIDKDSIILSDKYKNIFKNVNFLFNTHITNKNYKKLLSNINKNDIIIDCAYDIGTLDIIKFCNERGANHINSCIQEWDIKDKKENYIENELYILHKNIENYNNNIVNKNFNAIVSMGCNPGNVSLWVRKGIYEIAKHFNISDKLPINKIAQLLKINVIHISEKDTQVVSLPKSINEYCNTWSKTRESYYGEALSSVAISWGTHEININDTFNQSDILHYDNNNMMVLLNKQGVYTYAQSWLPLHGKFIGNIICHDETYTIGNNLTISENNVVIYKPSIYYVYSPCNEAKNSLYELKENNEDYQKTYRLLTDEIIAGNDLLGLTYFLENGDIYWIGSTLDINESREIFDNEINEIINATILQVIAGYISGIFYLIDLQKSNKNIGLIIPDDIPLDYMKYQLPFLGDFIFLKNKYHKLSIVKNNLTSDILKTNKWDFNNFLINF